MKKTMFELSIEVVQMTVYQSKKIFMKFIQKEEIYKVKKKLEKKIQNFFSTEIEWIPLNIDINPSEKRGYD